MLRAEVLVNGQLLDREIMTHNDVVKLVCGRWRETGCR